MRQESFLALHSEDPKSAAPGAHTATMQIIYQHQRLLSSVMFITKNILFTKPNRSLFLFSLNKKRVQHDKELLFSSQFLKELFRLF